MTAVQAATDARAVTLPWLLRRAAVLTWFELPRVAAVCAIWMASLLPFTVAVLTGQWWLIAIGSLPATLLFTGMARFAAIILRGDRPRVRDAFAFDPVLALSMSAAGTAVGLLVTEPTLELLGFVVAAVVLVLAPYALAYGAVRGRRGLATWRGAFILVAFRPSWALTVLALFLIGGFIVVASVGTLGLIAPVLLSVFTAGTVGHLLDVVDGRAAR
ncbi:hypothetical protein BH10ACT7_BH10ACT7_32140 [soil metagenome]